MKTTHPYILLFLLIMQGFSASAQWFNLAPPTNLALDRASFPTSQKILVASTSHNKVYRSNDGGTTWDSISFPGTVIDVQFLNADTGFVIYNASPNHPLSVTTNGGNTWTDIIMTSIGPFENLQRMKFTDFVTGHFVNMNAEILRTADQGATITNHPLGTYGYINDVENLKSDTLIMSGWDGTFNYMGAIIRSNDGGMNWQSLIHDSLYSTYTGTHFLNGHHGYVVYQQGWSGINSRIGISMNGGLSWVTIGTDTVNTHQDIYMLDQLQGYITTLTPTGTGLITKTTDGSTWIPDHTTTYPVRKFFAGGSILYGIGDGGTIVKKNIGIGINEVKKEKAIQIYPNPSNGNINLTNTTFAKIRLISFTGEIVLNMDINPFATLDLSHLVKGIYSLELTDDSGVSVAKIVLQ